MKNVKAPLTMSYDISLSHALRDPQQAAAYLQAALEESTSEPELLQAVLTDIAIARAADRADVPAFALQPMHQAIPDLMLWLNRMGLQLSVTPIAQDEVMTVPQPLTSINSKAA
jgi:hypothetical protein